MTHRSCRMRLAAGVVASIISIGHGVVVGHAQTTAPPVSASIDPVRGQSIEELVALALRQAPSALSIRARAGVAQGELDQAGRRPNPALSFERRDEVGGMDHQTAVGFTVPLDLFRRSARLAVAERSVELARHDVAERERQLATEVRLLTVRLLAEIRQLQVQQDVAAANQTTVELIAARVESGATPAVERDGARIEAQLSEVDVRRQRASVETAAAALRSAVGLAPADPLVLRETLEEVAQRTASATGARDLTGERALQAIDVRSDVRKAEAEIAREAARQELLRREARADVSVVGSYMRMAAGFPQFGVTPTGALTPIRAAFDTVAVGAMVVLPWRNRNQGAIAAAGAAAEAARHERDALRIGALNELAALQQREALARAALSLFDGGLRDLAATNLAIIRESYQLGRATLLEVQAESRRRLGVEAAYGAALLELMESRIALSGALGETR